MAARVGCWDARLPVNCISRGPRCLNWWPCQTCWRDMRAPAPGSRSCAFFLYIVQTRRCTKKPATQRITVTGKKHEHRHINNDKRERGFLLSPSPHAPGNYSPPSPANLPTLHWGGNKRLEAGHGGNKRLEAGRLRGNSVRWRVAPAASHSSSHGVERHVRMTVAAAKTFTGHPPARARLSSGRGRRARPGREAAVYGCDSWTAKCFFDGQRGAVGGGGGCRGGRDDRGRGRRDGGGWRIIDGDVRGCHVDAVLTASHRPRCGPTGPTGSDSFWEVWICRRRCACSVILHTINTRGVLMRPDVAHGTNLYALGLHGKQKVQKRPDSASSQHASSNGDQQ